MARNQIIAFGAFAFLVWSGPTTRAQSGDSPALSVRASDAQSVRIAWPKAATSFTLEATDQLGSSQFWQPVTNPPVASGEELTVTLAAGGVARYFRLRGGSVPDGDDDDDGLLNTNEIARGTSPSIADTDGDGWTDGVEVADGTNPLSTNSAPRTWFVGRPLLDVALPSSDELGTTGYGVTMGRPPVEVVFLAMDEVASAPGVTFGRPPVEVVFTAFDEVNATGGVTIGRPPVELVFPSLSEVDASLGVTLGRPPLELVFPALDEIGSSLTGITLGRPPVSIRYVP